MCRNFSVGQEPDPTGYYSPFATRHSLFSIRHSPSFFGSAGASPSHFFLVPRPASLVPSQRHFQRQRKPLTKSVVTQPQKPQGKESDEQRPSDKDAPTLKPFVPVKKLVHHQFVNDDNYSQPSTQEKHQTNRMPLKSLFEPTVSSSLKSPRHPATCARVARHQLEKAKWWLIRKRWEKVSDNCADKDKRQVKDATNLPRCFARPFFCAQIRAIGQVKLSAHEFSLHRKLLSQPRDSCVPTHSSQCLCQRVCRFLLAVNKESLGWQCSET
ncbi:MAG: hypothetical protein YYHSYBAR_000324 [Candidatus Fervidibacter sacchari]